MRLLWTLCRLQPAPHAARLNLAWQAAPPRRCEGLVGEVVQAPPAAAVVRLLDDMSDTVRRSEPSLALPKLSGISFASPHVMFSPEIV